MSDYLPVSVIVPTYNRANYLVETLNSILYQQIENLELIVVDDASTDDSKNILTSFTQMNPEIKLIFLEKNLGESNAVNIGWSLATKKYISIVNSDDPPHKYWLKDMANDIALNPSFGFYYPNRLVIDRDGAVLRREELKDWSTKVLYERLIPIASAGLIIDRDSLPGNFLPRDPKVEFPSDLIQMFNLAQFVRGHRAKKAWGTWREHSDSASGSSDAEKKAQEFEESVRGWILANQKHVDAYSRESFRTIYLYANMWKLLRKNLGLAKSFSYLAKTPLCKEIKQNPYLVFVGTYIVMIYFVKIFYTFPRRKFLYLMYSKKILG